MAREQVLVGEERAGRDFAEHARTADDLVELAALVAILADASTHPGRRDGWRCWTDAVGAQRLLVPSWRAIAAAPTARGVGFFGQLRPVQDDDFPPALEPAVAEAGAADGWLLAYLNVCFAPVPGADAPRYGNLVVVRDRDAAAATLERSAAHVEAVERSPGAYRSLRIHRIELDGPPLARPPIAVSSTLCIDYTCTPPWRAVRIPG